jgi:hypothetical protein
MERSNVELLHQGGWNGFVDRKWSKNILLLHFPSVVTQLITHSSRARAVVFETS